jgi:hypothetical protein
VVVDGVDGGVVDVGLHDVAVVGDRLFYNSSNLCCSCSCLAKLNFEPSIFLSIDRLSNFLCFSSNRDFMASNLASASEIAFNR